MKVTAIELVKAIKADDWLHWATSAGWVDKEEYGDYQALLFALQHLADLVDTTPEPTPTIPGTINGTPTTFEVVYRAED